MKRLALLFLAGSTVCHAQTYPGQFPAGSIMANPTGTTAAPIPWLSGASNSVNSTGIPGLSGQQFYIGRTPSSVDPTSAQATLRVDRTPTYTGGTPGNVFNAILGYAQPSAGVADYQWAILGQLQNNATAGQNVALVGASFANSTGPTWAMDLIAHDTVSTTNSTVNLITAEMDLLANGTDSPAQRVMLHLVLEKQNGAGAAVHTARGIWLDGIDGAANDIYDTGIVFSSNATFGVGIDMSAATISTTAYKSPGFSVNATGLLASGAAGVSNGQITLSGTTSGSNVQTVSATGGHLTYSGSGSAPTANTCTGFANATGSSDTAGRITFTSATTCSITFGTAYTNIPTCAVSVPAGGSVTTLVSTSGIAFTFGTAQTGVSWICYGS